MTDMEQTVVAHLPYLRRYARAVTGSQTSGDNHVGQFLAALIEDPIPFAESDNPRRDLYRAFQTVLTGFEKLASDNVAMDDSPLAERLAELSPVHRQMLLLTSVEAFSTRDAGVIVGVDEAEARSLISSARASMVKQRPTVVLIVEDEPVIALNLSDIMRGAGHTVSGVATTKSEAIEMAAATAPGLVLCDIQLQDGSSGLAAAREILEAIAVPVIFITAFPERLLTGDMREPTFLVTKPFVADTVLVAVSQALLTKL